MKCYSGGADGADKEWAKYSDLYQVLCVNYTADGIKHLKKDRIKLLDSLLYLVNSLYLHRGVYPYEKEYTNNLLRRNALIATESDVIYAVAEWNNEGTIYGGTAWCCYFGWLMKKDVYVFNEDLNGWYKMGDHKWEKKEEELKLSGVFAGIGKREIQPNGIKAIEDIFKRTFNLKGVV